MNDALMSVGAIKSPAVTPRSNVAAPSTVSPEMAVNGNSFEAVLSQLSSNAVDNLKAGEAAAVAGLQGKASTREVVDAVMKAEQSLQTVIAVRDKVISAYLEVSRMQI
ncbi:MAG: flagellar hook-basal body complex protein FliE [Aestuariivirgaceae bacterium]